MIGHSGATGYDSDPVRARWSHNSWVTGDNPLVKSLYARILARNPAVRGHKFNLAINGSNVASLLLQARKAVTMLVRSYERVYRRQEPNPESTMA